jgi:hypothetical protein
MSKRFVVFSVAVSALMLAFAIIAGRELLLAKRVAIAANPTAIQQQLLGTPLAFTRNDGQWDERVRFRSDAGHATMWFLGDGAYYQFTRRILRSPDRSGGAQLSANQGVQHTPVARPGEMPDSIDCLVIRASFVGANPRPRVVGDELLEHKSNYFLGNDSSKWRTAVPNYDAVVFPEIYSGIDLKYYGNGAQMEYDFIVSPGADPSQIVVHYDGAKSVTVNGAGELAVETDWGTVMERTPSVFQVDGDRRIALHGEYVLCGDDCFGFQIEGGYNPELALVIDPVLGYSTYLGGSYLDEGRSIAVDAGENAYVAGTTESFDFPPATSSIGPLGGTQDVFVTKLNSTGGIVYNTYFGGGQPSSNGNDNAYGIAVDGNGYAYITGATGSTDFPTQTPCQLSNAGFADVFVTKLSPAGDALVYSTYLGGSYDESGASIAVDGSGNACITGITQSSNFPTTASAFQSVLKGSNEAFVTKLNSAGSPLGVNDLVYSTYLGGSGADQGNGIAVDGSGNAYITGTTYSNNFPKTNPAIYRGNGDAFVIQLSPTGAETFSTTWGGDGTDNAWGIAVDGSGNAYVGGATNSTSCFPPFTNSLGPVSGWDVFVTQFTNTYIFGIFGYNTRLGGGGVDGAAAIAVDGGGNAYVTGSTESTNFPTVIPFQQNYVGIYGDAFLTKLNSSGSSLAYSSYLGGSEQDNGFGIAAEGSGCVFLTGWAGSGFPTTIGAYQSAFRGDQDAFVAKMYDPSFCFPCAGNQVAGRPDAWMRDDPQQDVGSEPSAGVMWDSPDIWVLDPKPPLYLPPAAIDPSPPGTRRFTKEHIHENPEYATDPNKAPWIYVKVCNRGDQPVSGTVHIYFACGATGLAWPTKPLGTFTEIDDPTVLGAPFYPGDTHISGLPPGQTWVVDKQWQNIEKPDICFHLLNGTHTEVGHYCLLARFVADPPIPPLADDPINVPPEVSDVWVNTYWHNNIAWKNVQVVDLDPLNIAPPGGGNCDPFFIRNVSGGDTLIDLEFNAPVVDLSGQFLAHGRVFVHIETALMQDWQLAGGIGTGLTVFDDSTIEIVDSVAHMTGIPVQEAEERVACIEFDLLPGQQFPEEQQFRFNVTQSVEGATHPDGGMIYDIRVPATCFATGDVDGDGVPFAVTDLLHLIRFVNFAGPPPSPLYQGDLSGDGFIDQADIDAFNCYFIQGISCFPVFPVPTTCNPDTVRGCCCSATGCAVRSPVNCTAVGGTYHGDGSACCHRVYIDTVRTLNGLAATVPIIREDASLPIGGFDLLVSYDQSALTFLSAAMGSSLDSLEWEYFTYRTGAGGNCTGGCPSGMVRLIAIADLDNGPTHHPIIGHDDSSGILATLKFQVTGDQNFIGQCIPVRFYWNDCGDNVFSSVSGDTTYLENTISDASGNMLWEEDDDVQFPESARPRGLGAPDSCLTNSPKGQPERRVCFGNGWICINEPPDDRGDINLNGIANEVGDAVLFTNYFVYGPSVWSPPYEQSQILATDINDDGIVLTVADLIYLIRVITGDASAFPPNAGTPKTSPYANSGTPSYQTEGGTLRVSTNSSVDLGGALYVFGYSNLTVGAPILSAAASSLRIMSEAKNGELRVLVYAWDKGALLNAGSNEIFTVPIAGEGTIELVETQLSDASGMLLSTSMAKASVPTDYALLQNYPNPFNAGTVIPFALKKSAHWSLVIYNILGQEVRTYEGEADASVVKVAWDGTSGNGQTMSSGTYLYRITTPEWTASKKMTLIK